MFRWIVGSVVLVALSGFAWSAEPIKPDQYSELMALIKPCEKDDVWNKIPWQVDLWQARRQAAEEGKPVLLWEMDGHPLGCV